MILTNTQKLNNCDGNEQRTPSVVQDLKLSLRRICSFRLRKVPCLGIQFFGNYLRIGEEHNLEYVLYS